MDTDGGETQAEEEAVSREGERRLRPELASLPVRLHLSLGDIDLPAETVANLPDHHVLPLGSTDHPVRIEANGRFLAWGALVECNGQLGVRILPTA